MSLLKDIFYSIIVGLKKSFKIIIKLCIYIIPVYLIVEILEYTSILGSIAGFFSPVMNLFGLPGEGALGLILAGCVNIYAALGAIGGMILTTKQLTILGVMIGCAHTLPIETTVLKGINMPRYLQLIFRIGAAIILGIILNLIWR